MDGFFHQAADIPRALVVKKVFFMTLFQKLNSAIFATPKMTYA